MSGVAAGGQVAAPAKVYGPALRWRVILGLICVGGGIAFPIIMIWALFNASPAADLPTLVTAIALSFLFFDAFLLLYYLLMQSRLAISPAGVYYSTISHSVTSDWQNVAGVGEIWIGNRVQNGLILREPGGSPSPWLQGYAFLQPLVFILGLLTLRPVGWLHLGALGRVIPLDFFDPHWASGEIGAEISRHAPHALQTLSAEQVDAGPGTGAPVEPAPGTAPQRSSGGCVVPIVLLLVLLPVEALLGFAIVRAYAGATDIPTLRVPGTSLRGAAFSPDGRVLATGGSAVRLWDASTLAISRTLDADNVYGTAPAFSPDGALLAIAMRNNTVELRRAGDAGLLAVLEGHADDVSALAFSPDGVLLATGGDDNTVRLWRVAGAALLATLRHQAKVDYSGVTELEFSGDGSMLISVAPGTARLWRVPGGEEIPLPRTSDWIDSGAISPGGATIALGTLEGPIQLRGLDGALLRTLQGHTSLTNALAFSPDGLLLASAGFDGSLRLWDVAAGRSLRTVRGYGDGVYGVAFSPDGGTVASVWSDGTVRLVPARR